jgi:hypothetical protein
MKYFGAETLRERGRLNRLWLRYQSAYNRKVLEEANSRIGKGERKKRRRLGKRGRDRHGLMPKLGRKRPPKGKPRERPSRYGRWKGGC